MNRLFLLFLMFSVALFARLNPFEPVNMPMKEADANMKPMQVDGQVFSEDDGNRTVKIMYDKSMEPESVQLDNKKEMEMKKTISMPKSEMKIIESNTSKMMEMKKVVKKEQPKPKPKPMLLEKCYKPLPFLTIDLKKNKIDIESREKYKVKKLYTIPTEKKIVIDFSGSVKHYTKNGMFVSQEFTSYKIGNHPEQNFFRVVIKTKHNPEKYLPVIEKNMLTITYKK